jgi:hypothetical protein
MNSVSEIHTSVRGGSSSSNTLQIVLIVVVIVLIMVVLGCVLTNMSYGCGTYSSTSTPVVGGARANTNKVRLNNNHPIMSQQGTQRRRANVNLADMRMPSQPLSAGTVMADATTFDLTTSSMSGDISGEESTLPRWSEISDSKYNNDSGLSVPSDVTSMQALLPDYSQGTVGADGVVDPSTGLPLMTAERLMRGQMLGGIGAGSFLRPQQDPLSGLKRSIGNNPWGAMRSRADVELQRQKFNAMRTANPDFDALVGNISEHAYF